MRKRRVDSVDDRRLHDLHANWFDEACDQRLDGFRDSGLDLDAQLE